MKNKQQKESKWLLVASGVCIFLAIVIKIAQTDHTLTFENESIMFHVEQVQTKDKVVIEPTIEDKIKSIFHEQPEIAVAVAKIESGKRLNPSTKSTTDLMKDGRPFSIGLMQINLTWHILNGVDCSKAFTGKDYKAVVTDESLYEKCVELASNPDTNLETARKIYNKYGFNAWGAYTNGSYKRNL